MNPDLYTLTFPNPAYRPPVPVARVLSRRKSRVGWIALALIVGACATVPTKVYDPTPTLTQPITAAERDNLKGDTKAVAKDLADAQVAIKAVAAQDVQTQNELATAQKFIADHNNDWLGARAHRWLKWIVGILSAAFIGWIVVTVLTGGATGVATWGFAGHFLAGLATGGYHWIATAVKTIGAWKWHAPTIAANLQTAQAKAAATPNVTH